MKPFSRRSFVRLAGAGILASSLLPYSVAFAADPQAPTADRAIPLVDRPLAGRLEGDTAGRFAYYKFDYPGDGSVATVAAQITPDDPDILRNAGIVIYATDGTVLVQGGQQPKHTPNASGDVIYNDLNKRGSYVIQVFNYNPQTAIDYTIWVKGVPVPSAATIGAAPAPGAMPAPVLPGPGPAIAAPIAPPPAPAPAPAPVGKNDVPQNAIQLQSSGSWSDALEGDQAGRFRYFKFQYPGDSVADTIRLHITPDDGNVLKLAGFNVYGPTANKLYVQGGASAGQNPNVAGDLISNEAGEYVIQVYNYNPGTTINFTLTASGLSEQPAAAPVAAPPAAAPAAAAAPAPAAQPAATGTQNVDANSFSGHLAPGGQTAHYEFTYPGDESVYTIGLNVTPNDGSVIKNANFKVYGPVQGKVYAEGGYQGGMTPNVTGNVISRDPGTYIIQVYNYSQVPIDYTVSLQANQPPGEVLAGRAKTP